MDTLRKMVEKTSFPHKKNLILLFSAGSNLHGAKLKGDLDIHGVYIEPLQSLFGLEKQDNFESSTGGNTSKNTDSDVDFSFKSLREWVRLAAQGNPTMLAYLFVPDALKDSSVDNSYFKAFTAPSTLFASKSALKRFLGYGKAQYERLIGTRGSGKHGQRDDLINQWGYDPKAAMHMIRMMQEGLEFATTAHLTYPRPEVEELLAIRKGAFSIEDVLARYKELNAKLEEALHTSVYPEQVDLVHLNNLLVFTHKQFHRL